MLLTFAALILAASSTDIANAQAPNAIPPQCMTIKPQKKKWLGNRGQWTRYENCISSGGTNVSKKPQKLGKVLGAVVSGSAALGTIQQTARKSNTGQAITQKTKQVTSTCKSCGTHNDPKLPPYLNKAFDPNSCLDYCGGAQQGNRYGSQIEKDRCDECNRQGLGH